jgi:hypothetical protein
LTSSSCRLWSVAADKLFKEEKIKLKEKKKYRLRAYGIGPSPIKPTKAYDPQVGSEGLVAHLATELCREFPKSFFSHPGPATIRKHRIRRFMLLTDFVGSGKRVRTYIEAAWRVRSVRSWWSAGIAKGLRFEVVAYAATLGGRQNVEDHPGNIHYLCKEDIGPVLHARTRGFSSTIGLKNHLGGLISFASQVEPLYGNRCANIFTSIAWPT